MWHPEVEAQQFDMKPWVEEARIIMRGGGCVCAQCYARLKGQEAVGPPATQLLAKSPNAALCCQY